MTPPPNRQPNSFLWRVAGSVRQPRRIAVLVLLLCAVAAEPAMGSGWVSRHLAIGEMVHSNLNGISCPTASLCLAVGESDAIASTWNPTGASGEWQIVRPYDSAVETDNKCFLPPPNNPGTETPCPEPPPYRQIRAISCPSSSLCVAVTYDGYIYSSTNPTGPASSWRVADGDGTERDTHLESISCPDPGFCVAVSGNRYTGGKVLTSTNPTGPSSAWQAVQLDESLDLRGVSCLSRSFCFAVASNGRIVESTNPGGGAAAWNEVGTPGGPGDLEAVSCTDGGGVLCVTGNAGGNLLTTTTIGASPSSWSEINGGGSVQISGVSCPSSSRCAAVDKNGDVLTSTDPTGGPGSWTFENLVPYAPQGEHLPVLNALFGVSCPSTLLCALVGAEGRVFINDDPFSTPNAAAPEHEHRHDPKRPRTILIEADAFHSQTRQKRFRARFRFHATSQVRGFVCKRDQGRYRPCQSPLRYWVPIGPHVLRVRAIGPTGLRGPVALRHFRAIHNPQFKGATGGS